MAAQIIFLLMISIIVATIVSTLAASVAARYGFRIPVRSGRIGHLDGLRGYLALAVMVHHFAIWLQMTRLGLPWIAPPVNFLEQCGATGVALFFMTTGAVFYSFIIKAKTKGAWPNLYIKRVFRIVPLIACSVLLIIAILLMRGHRISLVQDTVAALT